MAWISAGSPSVKEMQADIDRMSKEIRERRISEGKKPEPPDPFVSTAMVFKLMMCCDKLYNYLTKYVKLCHESGAVIPVDGKVFDPYRNYLKLIGQAEKNRPMPICYYMGMDSAIHHIENPNSMDPKHYVRQILASLDLAELTKESRFLSTLAYDHDRPKKENDDLYLEVKAEYDRLNSDEEFFNSELQRYLEHYETIKGEL